MDLERKVGVFSGEKYVFLVHFRGEVCDFRWFGVGFLRKPGGDLMIPCC